jgi:hypothetical protein
MPWRALVLMAVVLAWAAPALAQPYKAPRTPWGAPDLQGVWTNLSLTTLERPPAFTSLIVPEAEAAAYDARRAGPPPSRPGDPVGGNETEWFDNAVLARIRGQARSSWLVDPPDGRLPYTEAVRKKLADLVTPKASSDDHPEALSANERCLVGLNATAGPPMINARYNANYEIVQTQDFVVIVVEMNHDARIIRLKDRAHLPTAMRPWMGDSVGWWERDTLVVETTNLNPGQSLRAAPGGASYYVSQDAKIVERFTRTSRTQILYEFQVEDPATFTRPWRAEMALNAARGRVYEYACHEGNYSMAGILAGGREIERAEREATEAR